MPEVASSDAAESASVAADSATEGTRPGLCQQFLSFFKDLRGEAIMLFYALSNFLPVIFLQHFVLVNVCRREFPHVDCSQAFNSTVEADIQHAASNVLLWVFVIRTVPSVFILMLWGPWSDLHGRLLPTLAPMIGNILTYVIFCLANEYDTWPQYVLILAVIPSGLTGHYSSFMMGYFGWVNDAHSPHSLVTKMSTVNEAHGHQMMQSTQDDLPRGSYKEIESGVSKGRFRWHVEEMINNYLNLRREIRNPYSAHHDIVRRLVERCPYFYHMHRALSYSDHYKRTIRPIAIQPRTPMDSKRSYLEALKRILSV